VNEKTYGAEAVKISTLEVEEEIILSLIAKSAAKNTMKPRNRPIEWTLARMVMAMVGRRHATWLL